MKTIKFKGEKYIIQDSPRKDKQLMVITPLGKKIHFGDPLMPEFPSTKRGDRYCARSFGIGNLDNPESANFWSRKYLWKCKGKKSMPTFKDVGFVI